MEHCQRYAGAKWRQAAQITFNDDIINIVAGMLEEKTKSVQTRTLPTTTSSTL
jgi:hypothetical protein